MKDLLSRWTVIKVWSVKKGEIYLIIQTFYDSYFLRYARKKLYISFEKPIMLNIAIYTLLSINCWACITDLGFLCFENYWTAYNRGWPTKIKPHYFSLTGYSLDFPAISGLVAIKVHWLGVSAENHLSASPEMLGEFKL